MRFTKNHTTLIRILSVTPELSV